MGGFPFPARSLADPAGLGGVKGLACLLPSGGGWELPVIAVRVSSEGGEHPASPFTPTRRGPDPPPVRPVRAGPPGAA